LAAGFETHKEELVAFRRAGSPTNMRILAVTNMYPTPEDPTSGTFVEQQVVGLRRTGLCVDVHLIRRDSGGMRVYRQAADEVRTRIADFRPDLMHVMYGGVMADVLTRAIPGIPTVVSFCGSDLLGEHLSGRVRKMIATVGVWSSWRAAKRATGIVVKSLNLQKALPRERDRLRAQIIPNGIDLERFQPLDRASCRAELGLDAEGFHVLFPTNSGDPCKRIGLALAGIEALGRTGIRAQLHQLRGIPHHKVPTWINACDTVILTSLHEGSPNVVKEALSCDVPVVSVDVGDVRERIEGIEGCYIADAEPDALAAKLRAVFEGPRRVAGRERMRELSLERVAERIHKYYADTIAQNSAGTP
jgi:glycosyltransferase involved in cell wall biosynthesis